ncbi:biotin--[acetyl-CoA-carboxylase] ligase [Paenibacillus sp. y28]|uniref:biotin--[acetyl-CoA-carboxylase] ligase n=1 Tax=Paenibacillus sp. y28 TaxID=3129110 RepID=UPI00301777B8
MKEALLDTLLGLFDAAGQGAYVSGEQISERLGCSRAAVWKHITALRAQGYEFEAVSRKGYRLLQKPERLTEEKLFSGLKTKKFGHVLKLLDTVTSTQDIAKQIVREGAPEGTVVLAEVQTAGRGRMGRAWHSPAGHGVWMSLILRPPIPLPLTPQLTLLTAVALCRAIRTVSGVHAVIKWPNDILVEGRKVSGILLESTAEDERLSEVIVGMGVSVNLREEDYPPELLLKATSLRIEAGRILNRIELIQEILHELEQLYQLYLTEGFAPIRLLWEALTSSLHRPIRVHTARGVVEGTADSIDELGALRVRQADGELKTIYSGDMEW